MVPIHCMSRTSPCFDTDTKERLYASRCLLRNRSTDWLMVVDCMGGFHMRVCLVKHSHGEALEALGGGGIILLGRVVIPRWHTQVRRISVNQGQGPPKAWWRELWRSILGLGLPMPQLRQQWRRVCCPLSGAPGDARGYNLHLGSVCTATKAHLPTETTRWTDTCCLSRRA